MQFGFDALTDEARYALERAAIFWRRRPLGGVDVFTESFDVEDSDYRDSERDLPLAEQSERPKKYRAQGVRVWKHPDTGQYWYLINNTVFYSEQRYTKDYRFYPPTVEVKTVLDVPEDPDQYRDLLNSLPPMAVSRLI